MFGYLLFLVIYILKSAHKSVCDTNIEVEGILNHNCSFAAFQHSTEKAKLTLFSNVWLLFGDLDVWKVIIYDFEKQK